MMRTKLRHCSLFAGSLLLAACGDDSTTSQDTDASSSTGPDDTSAGPTDPTIDPDSSSSETSSPTTDPDTTADSSSSEEDSGTCIIPTTILADPSFESGAMASEWGEASSAFGTPLCDAGCGGPEAQDGSWFVWLGGSAGGDIGGVSQEVTIGEADELELSFYFQYGAAGSGADIFQLQIDGDVLWEITNADLADYADWTLVTVDVSAYADGGNHDIDFTGNASGNANFFLDNVKLETCGEGAAITESDTVDAAITGGGETETDTTETGGMLTCEDLGDDLPISQDGNNGGAGDDIVGSCLIGNGDGAGEDVGFTWTAPANGTYRFDTLGSDLDTVLILLDACDSGGNELGCSDDTSDSFQSVVTLGMTAGQTIAVVVDGWGSADVADFTLHINQISCEEPTDLGNILPIEQDDDNTGAGDDVSASCGGVGGEDVIYTWEPQEDGIYSIYAVSLQMAPVVSAYPSGSCGDPGAEIGCGAGNGLASFTAVLAADQEITIVVDGANADEVGTYELNIEQTGVLAGDCCAADDSPGCESATVTQCTCGVDVSGFAGPVPVDPADCCGGEWSEACANVAAGACDAGCGLVDGGTCCDSDSGVGGCDATDVETCVCDFDAYCCDTEWDAECAAKAQLFCLADCG